MSTNLSVGIIGAGPGGLALGMLLSRAGFRDFTIFDREDDVGGTWRINTYPGLACDVKSHLYSYSFDLNSHWSRLWSAQPEILAYFERCADKYGLRPHLKLRTEIRSARWESDTQRWCLTTSAGEAAPFQCRRVRRRPVHPAGVSRPRRTGAIHRNGDALVAVGPLGAARRCAGCRAGDRIDGVAADSRTGEGRRRKCIRCNGHRPGYCPSRTGTTRRREHWVFARIPFAKRLYRTRLWLRSESNISVIEHGSEKTQDFTAIALNMLEKTVGDEELRRKLTPDHPMGCKRLVFSSDYLPALTRPNVEVVASPARYLKARSLVTEDGTERDVDVVVCATGYAAADYLGQLDVSGEHGTTLREVWQDGAHGISRHGRARIPELLHALRAEHERRLQQRDLHARGAGALHRAGVEVHAAQGQDVRRRATGRAGGVHRQDRPVDDRHGVDHAVQQLLSRGQRAGGHAVAAKRA